MKFNIFLLCFYLFILTTMAQDAQEETDHNAIRIENEFKLAVPKDIEEQVWIYLTSKYDTSKEGSVLLSLNKKFKSKISEEYFIDRYFDDSDLTLLSNHNCIRHRTRHILNDPNHKKNGRSLVQIKLNNISDRHILSRGELKYKVRDDLTNPLKTPVLGLMKKNDLMDFLNNVATFNLVTGSLKERLVLKQNRRRVYIELSGEPFATITLDDVTSEKFFQKMSFTELEIELNEINYTNASADERKKMQEASSQIMSEILKSFPSIQQDQTPKYNKIYNQLISKSILFKYIFRFI